MVEESGFSLDHAEECEAFESTEGAGGGDGEYGFGDERFDHEVGHGLEFGFGEEVDGVVSAEEAFKAGFVGVVGPSGDVFVSSEDGELEGAVGCVDDAREEPSRVVVNDGDDVVVAEEHVARVPVGVGDLGGPGGQAQAVDGFGGGAVLGGKVGDKGLDVAVTGPAAEGAGDESQAGIDAAGSVVAAGGRLPGGLEVPKELVEQPEDPARVDSRLDRLGVVLAGDVFEELVHPAA